VVEGERARPSWSVGARRRRRELGEGRLVLENVDKVSVALSAVRLARGEVAVDEAERRVVHDETCSAGAPRQRRYTAGSGERDARDKMAPLLPYRPPMPVLTVMWATSRSRATSLLLTNTIENSCERAQLESASSHEDDGE